MLRIIGHSVFVRTVSALGLALGLSAGSAWANSPDELVRQMQMSDGAINAQSGERPAIHAQTGEAKGPQGRSDAAGKMAGASSADQQWLQKQLERSDG